MQIHFILIRKRFLLTFLLSGITYALLALIFDFTEGSEIGWWRLLVKALWFGFFVSLANSIVKDEFKSEEKPKG